MPKPTPDRHKDHSRQYNVRVENHLLDAFIDVCNQRNLKPAQVTRTLMQGFVDIAKTEPGRAPA